MHRRAWSVIGACGLALLAVIACVAGLPAPEPERPSVGIQGVFPAGTPSPAGYAPGLACVRCVWDNTTATPGAGQTGAHIDVYWSTPQPDLTVTPDWSSASARVAHVASTGMGAWLSLQIFENDYGNDPDVVYVPSGVPTIAYQAGACGEEYAPAYGDPTFRSAYAAAVASFLATFGADADVAGFALQLGASGETVNTYEQGCGAQAALEQEVSCAAYLEWVREALVLWRQGTDKPLTLATNLGACSTMSGAASARYFMQYANPPTPGAAPPAGATPVATPLYIGYRANGLAADHTRGWMYLTPAPFGWYQPGERYTDLGGAYYEPGVPAVSQVPTAELPGHTMRMLYVAAANEADVLFLQREWWPYIGAEQMRVITETLGTDGSDSPVAWAVFQEAEYGRGGNATWQYSGVPGPLTHLVTVGGVATPTPYCDSHVYATAEAYGGYGPPDACAGDLGTPAAAEDRNTLRYAEGSVVTIDLADDWVHAGSVSSPYSVTLRYKDDTTGSITLRYVNGSGVQATKVISKTGTGGWLSSGYSLTMRTINSLSGADLQIEMTSGATFLHSLVVRPAGAAATATPTRTITPTRTSTLTATSTATRTATPTPTGGWTPSPTPSPTITLTPSLTPTPTSTLTPTVTQTPTRTPVAAAIGAAPWIGPVVSTTIREDTPNLNYNATTTEYVWWNGATDTATTALLLRWPDLQKPVTTTHVVSASLTLHLTTGTWSAGDALQLDAYRLRTDWEPDTVTWLTPWQSPGAQGYGDRGDIDMAVVTPLGSLGSSITLDVSVPVRAWLDQGADNYGLALYLTAGLNAWLGIAGDVYPAADLRPELVVLFGYPSTVTPTATATGTPTPPPTPTATTTPPATVAATATSATTPTATPLPGLKLNEACLNPTTDLNLDGSANTADRAVELYNPGGAAIDLAGYTLEFGLTHDLASTYTFPRYSLIYPGNYKVVYSSQLRNAYGEAFTMPGGAASTEVRLYAPGSRVLVDVVRYSFAGHGTCYARVPNGNMPWLYGRPATLGRYNR